MARTNTNLGGPGIVPNLKQVLTAGPGNNGIAIVGSNFLEANADAVNVLMNSHGVANMTLDAIGNLKIFGYASDFVTIGATIGFDSTTGQFRIVDGSEGLNKVWTSDATGAGSWQTLPAGTLAVGDPVTGGTNWANLYVDHSGNLGQSFELFDSSGRAIFNFGDLASPLVWGDVSSAVNGTKLILTDSTGSLQFMHSGSVFGLDVSYFSATAKFGILQSGHELNIDGSVQLLKLQLAGNTYLSLDANNFLYKWGDMGSIHNGSTAIIDDAAKTFSMKLGLFTPLFANGDGDVNLGAWGSVLGDSMGLGIQQMSNIVYLGKYDGVSLGANLVVDGGQKTIKMQGGFVQNSQYSTPATGATITIDDMRSVAIANPAGTIAALTVVAPTAIDGREFAFHTTQIITAVTWSGGTFVGAPTSMGAGTFATFVYSSGDSKWHRIG